MLTALSARAEARTDRELLAAFAACRDEGAFAAVVHRHGPMVAAVCRRALGSADADDAFQAAFLLLARRAGSARWHESVRGWLYATAAAVARNARRRRAARARHERAAARPEGAAPVLASELGAILDDELAALPAKYRDVLVACCLDGKTRDEAAAELGVPVGTVKVRLERGRARLRGRLAARGVELPAALAVVTLGGALAADASAGVARAAAGWLAGDTGAVPTAVRALAAGVGRSMFSKQLVLAAGLLATVACGAGLAAVVSGPPPARPTASAVARPSVAVSRFAPVPPLGKPQPRKPMPKDVIEAWKQAGAEFAWIEVVPEGREPSPRLRLTVCAPAVELPAPPPFLGFGGFPVAEANEPEPPKPIPAHWLPAFRIPRAVDKMAMAAVPCPPVEFGVLVEPEELSVAALHRFDNLTHLVIERDRMADAHLAEIGRLKGLTHLEIGSEAKLTGTGAAALAGLRALTHLCLDMSVDDACAEHLARLTNLTHLDLGGYGYHFNMTDKGVVEIARLHNLVRLRLHGGARVTDAGAKALAGLPVLSQLEFVGDSIGRAELTDTGAKEFAKLQALTSLGVYAFGKLTDAPLKDFARLPNLTALKFDCNGSAVGGGSELSRLQKLTYLRLACGAVTDDGAKELGRLPALAHLDLWCSGRRDANEKYIDAPALTAAGAAELARLPRLTTLELFYHEMTGPAAEALAALPKLTRLTIHYSGTDAVVAGFARSKTLTRLDLLGCKEMTDAGAGELARCKTLTAIIFDNCHQVSKKGYQKLRDALPGCQIVP